MKKRTGIFVFICLLGLSTNAISFELPEIFKNRSNVPTEKYPQSAEEIKMPPLPIFEDLGNKSKDEIRELGFDFDDYYHQGFIRSKNLPQGMELVEVNFNESQKPWRVMLYFSKTQEFEKYKSKAIENLAKIGTVAYLRHFYENNELAGESYETKFIRIYCKDIKNEKYPDIKNLKHTIEIYKPSYPAFEVRRLIQEDNNLSIKFNKLAVGTSTLKEVREKYKPSKNFFRKTDKRDGYLENMYDSIFACSEGCSGLPGEYTSEFYFDETKTLCLIRIFGKVKDTPKYFSFVSALKDKYGSKSFIRTHNDNINYCISNKNGYTQTGCVSFEVLDQGQNKEKEYILEYSSYTSLMFNRDFEKAKAQSKLQKAIDDKI